MANTALDVSRLTNGVILTPEMSSEIWTDSIKQSALTQLATRVNLPGKGVKWQTLNAPNAAEWVGETAEKPVVDPSFGSKTMIPYKLAQIITVSEEFTRDAANLWNAVQAQASEAIAQAIDKTFLAGTIPLPGADGVDTLADAQTVSVKNGKYVDFVKIATTVLDNNGDLNGIAITNKGLAKFLSAVDENGRPLMVPGVGSTELGSAFGARMIKSPWGYKEAVKASGSGASAVQAAPEVLGVAGDWTQAYYGTVQGIRIKMTDTATVKKGATTINLWQRNMIAFLVETEVGFIVRDKSKFVVITGDNAA
mgnify:FL=1